MRSFPKNGVLYKSSMVEAEHMDDRHLIRTSHVSLRTKEARNTPNSPSWCRSALVNCKGSDIAFLIWEGEAARMKRAGLLCGYELVSADNYSTSIQSGNWIGVSTGGATVDDCQSTPLPTLAQAASVLH